MSERKPRGQSLLLGAAWHLVSQVVGRAFELATVVLLTRSLGPAGFGTIALTLTFQGIGGSLAAAGFPSSLLRIVPRTARGDRRRLLGITLVVAVPVSALIGGAFVFGAPWFADRFEGGQGLTRILPWIGVGLPFLVLGRTLVAYTRGLGTLWPTLASLTLPVMLLAGILYAVFPVPDLSTAGMAYFMSATALFAVGAVGLYRVWNHGDPEGEGGEPISLGRVLGVSVPMLTLAVVNQTSNWTDTLLLGFLADTAQLGVYHASARVPLILNLLLYSASALFAPAISRLFHRRELGALGDLYGRVTHTLILLLLPGVGLLVVAPDLVLTLFGQEFTSGVWILRILAVAQLVNVGLGPVGLMLSMTQHEWALLWTTVFSTVVAVVANIILIPRYGALGAAMAGGGTIVLNNLLRMVLVNRFLGIRAFRDWRTGLLVALGVGAAASGLLLRGWLAQSGAWAPWAPWVACAAVVAVYAGSVLALRAKLPPFLSFTDRVWS